MPKNRADIKLSSRLSISGVEALLNAGDASRAGLADFVYERLTERYILPQQHVPAAYKNGFSMIANCCLLIETYQCFRQGLNDTVRSGEGKRVFGEFFDTEPHFVALKGLGHAFYREVRCGILHQGETKKGWSISRKSSTLYNPAQKEINANIFLKRMHETLSDYRSELKREAWNGVLWTNCRNKINFIIANCAP